MEANNYYYDNKALNYAEEIGILEYKVFKNKNQLALELFPSIYDYFIAQSILDYVEKCHHSRI